MRLQYRGPDELYLKHGQFYEVEETTLKSGKRRLRFVDIGLKMTVDEYEYSRMFGHNYDNKKKRK